jgi:hypothetical protein
VLHVDASLAARVTGRIPTMPSGATQAFVVLPGQSRKPMSMPLANVDFNIPIGNLTAMPSATGNELRIFVQTACESGPLTVSTP